MEVFGRDRELQAIKKFVEKSHTSRLYVCAFAGAGKTAILRKFVENFREAMSIVYYEFSAQNDRQKVVSFLVEQTFAVKNNLKTLCEIQHFLQHTQQQLLFIFDNVIHEDALAWLPTKLSAKIKLIVACRNDVAQRTSGETLVIKPLEQQHMLAIINRYCHLSQISLSTAEKKQLCQQAQGHPLYLKVALEEITNGGMSVGQLAQSIDQLFSQTLQRLETQQMAVNDYLGVIAASYTGLSEQELHEILLEHHTMETLVHVESLLRNFVTIERGKYRFFHNKFAQIVKQRLGSQQNRKYHEYLAEFFAKRNDMYTCFARILLSTTKIA